MNDKQAWAGDFGTAYTERNAVDPLSRIRFWQHVITRMWPTNVFELGCNKGHNLIAIERVSSKVECVGMDVNEKAVQEAREFGIEAYVGGTDEAAARFGTRAFDLVFTAGVLIHLDDAELEAAMVVLSRMTRGCLLCVEYFSETPEKVEYRDGVGLWKRPYGALYEQHGLEIIDAWFVPKNEGFDDCTAWLLGAKQ